MSEKLISKIEKEDIKAPQIEAGGTAIVFQRHERYNRDRSAEDAGSIDPESSDDTIRQDRQFFEDLLVQEAADGVETMVLFVSSDTQYAGKGRRSLETGQLAQDAARSVFEEAGIDANERVLNFHPNFKTSRFEETGQDIRPVRGIVEPKIFDENPDFVKELGKKFNPEELQAEIESQRSDVQLSPEAFGAYEADLPEVVEMRERHGAEGVHDILDRTKTSLKVLERYSRVFHANNPNKRLVIWATSHYDTISPLVKDATDTEFSEYVPVDYGGGVVINVPPKGEGQTTLEAQGAQVPLILGKEAVEQAVKN